MKFRRFAALCCVKVALVCLSDKEGHLYMDQIARILIEECSDPEDFLRDILQSVKVEKYSHPVFFED